MTVRDYSLLGPDGERALKQGLAAARWYNTGIPAHEMKTLMQRSDAPAVRDTLLLFGLMIAFAGAGIWLWPSWWSAPCWLAYAVLYGSAMDSRWHECGHGTAFETPWMNKVVYQIACFMMVRNPVTWQASHSRHHQDTIIVGRDPEIITQRPPKLIPLILSFLGISDALNGWRRMLINAAGRLEREEDTYVRVAQKNQVVRVARIWCSIYITTLAAAMISQSWLPLMLIGFPRLFGAWHHVLTGVLQHTGLADNVTDHRLNSRTVYMNPVSRFIYWNMNYHLEHHMFPMVPYHKLPELHQRVRHDFPAANTSMWQAYRDEVIPALRRQMTDPDYTIVKELPAGAQPYAPALHTIK